MTRRVVRISVFLLTLLFSPTARGQQTDPSSVLASTQQLNNLDWKSRSERFHMLLRGESRSILESLPTSTSQQADDIKVALFHLLENENNFLIEHQKDFLKSGDSLTEGYTEYYASLIAIVGSLKDARAVSALVGAITTGGMATDALAAIGTAAVTPTIQALNSSDASVRQSAAIVLRKITDPKNFQNIPDPSAR
jgi:hypothetical protein